MMRKKIAYPKSLKDIPVWRQRQLARDLLWFSKFSPCERLRYIDREWEALTAPGVDQLDATEAAKLAQDTNNILADGEPRR